MINLKLIWKQLLILPEVLDDSEVELNDPEASADTGGLELDDEIELDDETSYFCTRCLMWYKKRRRYNPKIKEGQYYSISNKLKSQEKTNDQFEIMLSNLTLEEIVGLRLELAAKSVKNNLYGLKIWYDLPNIIKDAILKYTYCF